MTVKERRASFVALIVLIGFTLSVFFHYMVSNYRGLSSYPHSTFLFNPADRFNDFFNIYNATKGLDPYSNPVSVYFPFTFLLMFFFTIFKAKFAFGLFIAIFTFFFAHYIYTNFPASSGFSKISNLFVMTLMSYPFLFNIDRGNLECLLFIFLALFLHFYKKDQDTLSALFLSLAIAMKLYPGVFVILLLADRKYKNILLTGVLTVIWSVLSAAILNGGMVHSFFGLRHNLALFNQTYLASSLGLQHNTSLFGALKLFKLTALKSDIVSELLPVVNALINNYAVIALLFFALISIYIFLQEDLLWKKVALLTFAMLLLPQVSFDYKLIHVFLPLLLFINCDKVSRFDSIYLLFFALLLIPKDYMIIRDDISIAVLINPFLMVLAIFLIIYEKYARPES